MNPKPNIELHIEELVLHGFDPADRHGIAAGLQNKLTVLLREHGLPAAWQGDSAVIQADCSNIRAASRPTISGEQIADTIHGGAKQ